MICEVNKNQTS